MSIYRCAFFFIQVLLSTTALAESPNRVLQPIVEIEEDVYTFGSADNGSGSPMWCFGNTSIVRWNNDVFASRWETIPNAKPLNNCRISLLQRTPRGWNGVYRDDERTREPAPLAVFPEGRLFLSANPTLAAPDEYSGPAEPCVLEFLASEPVLNPRNLSPRWDGKPKFTGHSYRSFVADGTRRELFVMQNADDEYAEWSFRDQNGDWSAYGKLIWPWGADYEKPKPIRICYPAVALQDRRVYVFGVSDIVEPNSEWRKFKKELTGQEWDYDFRRLFYCRADDISTGKFHDWIEVASREETAGWLSPNDLYVAPSGDIFVLWSETAIDERLREKFFPDQRQRYSLEMAIIRGDIVIKRTTIVEGGEDISELRPGRARFQVTADEQLLVVYYVAGTNKDQPTSENRIVAVDNNGDVGDSVPLRLEQPLSSFFTATVRAGCAPSNYLDMFGPVDQAMRYARVRLTSE